MTHLIGPEAAAVKGRTVQLFLAVLALTVLWLGLNTWFPWVPTTDDCPRGRRSSFIMLTISWVR
jgi:hypothetical protein